MFMVILSSPRQSRLTSPPRLSDGRLWGKTRQLVKTVCKTVVCGPGNCINDGNKAETGGAATLPCTFTSFVGSYQNSWPLSCYTLTEFQLIVKTLNRFIAGEIQTENKNKQISLF